MKKLKQRSLLLSHISYIPKSEYHLILLLKRYKEIDSFTVIIGYFILFSVVIIFFFFEKIMTGGMKYVFFNY